jgi:hypothetical protein
MNNLFSVSKLILALEMLKIKYLNNGLMIMPA